MSYKKIVAPLSVSGIQKIQDELKEYKRWQKDKAKELAERLAMLGASVASIRFSRAVYTEMRDATVSVVAIPNGYAVKADGESVLFIEFGAGITYGTGHPEASEFGMGLAPTRTERSLGRPQRLVSAQRQGRRPHIRKSSCNAHV